MADERIEQVLRMVVRQQSQIVALRDETQALRDEVAAVQHCLYRGRLLKPEVFDASLREERATRYFGHFINLTEATRAVGLHAGPHTIRAAACASKVIRDALAGVWSIAKQLHPGYCLYVCGGAERYDEVLSSVERFNIASSCWEALPPMAAQRRLASAGAVAGRLYVCGGLSFEISLSSVERFDPNSNVWEEIPAMLVPRDSASSAAGGGRLYVGGGRQRNGWDNSAAILSQFEFLEPGQLPTSGLSNFFPLGGPQVWQALPPLQQSRYDAAAVSAQGRLYVCVGCADWTYGAQQPTDILESVECLDTATGVWQDAPPLHQPRCGAVAGSAAGKVFVCGGSNGDLRAIHTVECLDPEVGRWCELRSLLRISYVGAAGVMACDRMFVFGGDRSDRAEARAECFDPMTGVVERLPPMGEARLDAAVVVMLG